MMLPAAGPSPGLTCGLVLVGAVLLQSVCVAVTFLYFTNELKQVGGGRRPVGGHLARCLCCVFTAGKRKGGQQPGCRVRGRGGCRSATRAELGAAPECARMESCGRGALQTKGFSGVCSAFVRGRLGPRGAGLGTGFKARAFARLLRFVS